MTAVFLRTVIIYLVISLVMRFSGKRQLGELQITELVVTILISELAAIPMQDPNAPLLHGIVAIIVLVCLEIIISYICLKSDIIKKFFEGKSCILIDGGKIDQEQMQKVRFSLDDLLEALRQKGVSEIETVETAILEASGKVSVILKTPFSPVTKIMVNEKIKAKPFPITVISDGKFKNDGLKRADITKGQILNTLKKHGFKGEKEIFYMAVKGKESPTIIRKEGKK